MRGEIVEGDVNLLPRRAQGHDLLQKGDERWRTDSDVAALLYGIARTLTMVALCMAASSERLCTANLGFTHAKPEDADRTVVCMKGSPLPK